MAQQATFDTLRSLAAASISAAYAKIGTAATKPIHILKITNTTDADMLISVDGVNAGDILPKSSFCLYDVSANRDGYNPADVMVFRAGTQIWVKQVSAPSTGLVYVTMIYGG